VPVAVRISSAAWLRAELPRQRRFMAGTGIGGEYAAINSATGEMTPAKYRAAWTSASTARTRPDPLSAHSRRCSRPSTSPALSTSTDTGTQRVLNGLIDMELRLRTEALDDIIKDLRSPNPQWNADDLYVVLDTSVYIEHEDKLEKLDTAPAPAKPATA
jgi:hypothetical protein